MAQPHSHPSGQAHGPTPLERLKARFVALREDAEARLHRSRFGKHFAAPASERTQKRRRRRRRGFLIAALVALLAYPVGGTLFLWSGAFEKMMASEDLRIDIDNPSWTLWPGHIHVMGARVLVNGETQFKLSAKNLVLHVNLFALIHKRLSVTSISGDDVRYFMRIQVKSTKGIEERVAAYPKLEDLPGDPTLVAGKAAQTEERGSDFTVDIDGIDVKVSELWFMEYHYVGPGTLKGGFLIGPQRMKVNTSVQQLGPGELRFGADHVVAKNFVGRVMAQIPELNPDEHADESFLELVSADIDLKGDVTSLSHVGAYTPGTRFVNGAGPFAARLVLSKGRLGNDSRISFSTDKVGIRSDGFGLDTDWDFDARMDASKVVPANDEAKAAAADVAPKATDPAKKKRDSAPEPVVPTDQIAVAPASVGMEEADASGLPRLTSSSKSTYVSFSNHHGETFTVQVHNHEQRVVLRSAQLGRMTDIQHARVQFPEIVTTDMDDLAALTSEETKIRSKGGEAHASLVLDVDQNHVARGPFKADFTGLHFTAADIEIKGRGNLHTNVEADLDKRVYTVRDLFLRFTDVGLHVGPKDDGEDVSKWWTHVTVQHFTVAGVPPTRMEGHFTVLAKSAEPVLKTLAEKDEISSIIPALTNLNNLRIQAAFKKTDDVTDVLMEPVENSFFDVAGRYYAKGDKSRMAIVVGGKAVSLGIATDPSGTSVMPFAREGWLNEKLSAFPGKTVTFKTSQP